MRLTGALDSFEPRAGSLAAGRTLLAAAFFVTIAATPDRGLFASSAAVPGGIRCDGLRGLSLWCLAGPSPAGLLTARIVALLVLGVTAAGYRPRWTCVPHWYVTFGLAVGMSLPNGGEQVARAGTLLLIPVCLGDGRAWHWSRPDGPLVPAWRGAAYAGMLFLRLQVAIIYGEAAVAKLAVPEWRDGTAFYAVAHDPTSGLTPAALRAAGPALGSFPVVAALTWGTIGAELVIAGCVLGTYRIRRAALALVLALHAGIVLALGLVSFGLIMIAMATIALGGAVTAQDVGREQGSAPRVTAFDTL